MNKTAAEGARKPHFRNDGVRHATINNHRFHLRLTSTEHHNLWIDGRQPPLILDQTAADFASNLIDAMWLYQHGDGDESQQVVDYVIEAMYAKYMRRNRKLTRDRLRADLDRMFGIIMGVAESGCPAEMNLQTKAIDYDRWTAPARMDLAVTYRCNLQCGKCYLPGGPNSNELSMEEWLKIYDILWKIGVPQVVFTGGEPTMREDIVQLVEQADEFVTGLVTNGTNLVNLAEPLRDASLDYVQVTIESADPEIHDCMTQVSGSHSLTVDGIRKAKEVGLQVVTNTTLTKINAYNFPDTIRWLHDELGVEHVACNTLICSGKGTCYREENGICNEELRGILESACELAGKMMLDFQWYSPTCYNAGIDPMKLGFGIKCCSAAAHNMTIEPDGSVLPCQSWPDTVGNILADDWTKIWQHPTCVKLRKRKMAPAECGSCDHIDTCGGGCPLDHAPRKCS